MAQWRFLPHTLALSHLFFCSIVASLTKKTCPLVHPFSCLIFISSTLNDWLEGSLGDFLGDGVHNCLHIDEHGIASLVSSSLIVVVVMVVLTMMLEIMVFLWLGCYARGRFISWASSGDSSMVRTKWVVFSNYVVLKVVMASMVVTYWACLLGRR